MTEKTAKNLHKEIISLIKHKKYETHLDVGCGTGALINRLKGNVTRSYGIDMNEKDFKVKNAIFQKADLNKEFPFQRRAFDLITAVEVIEHIENQFYFLREISSRIKKGGNLIITSPNIYNFWSKTLFLFKNRFVNFMDGDIKEHINPLIENIFLKAAKDNNLKLIKIKYSSCHIPFIDIYVPFKNRFLGNVAIYLFQKTT